MKAGGCRFETSEASILLVAGNIRRPEAAVLLSIYSKPGEFVPSF
jgi:hypothetical protein